MRDSRVLSDSEAGPSPGQGRIALNLRIGVAGHRQLPDPHAIRREMDDAIRYLLELVPASYDSTTELRVTAVSSLAEGADRLLVDAVLDDTDAELGGRRVSRRLEVVLPMAGEDYVKTFDGRAASRDEFASLLKRADAVYVVGEAADGDHAFLAAAQDVARRSDVVFTVWDGQAARGLGGTADSVTYLREQHIPMVLIPAAGDRHWVGERLGDGPPGAGFGTITPDGARALAEYNAVRIDEGQFEAACTVSVNELAPAGHATPPVAQIRWVAPYFTRADVTATRFQRAYLQTTKALWTLGAAAVVFVAAQITFWPTKPLIVLSELAALIAVLLLYRRGRRRDLHERWISARFLSERFRAMFYLSAAGVKGERSASVSRLLVEDPSDSWLRRAITEVWEQRPSRTVEAADVPAIRSLLLSWISSQARYHRRTASRYRHAQTVLTRCVTACFAIAVVGAVVHVSLPYLAGHPHQLYDGFTERLATFVSIAAPACAAALTGYASQRDYRRHGARYDRVANLLADSQASVEKADDLATLQDLCGTIAQLMREESGDWFGVVRLNDLELPA
jgi:hypothetical protein